MTTIEFLIPIALALGGLGLVGLLWALKVGQYDDLDAAAWRILAEDRSPTATEGRGQVALDTPAEDGSQSREATVGGCPAAAAERQIAGLR